MPSGPLELFTDQKPVFPIEFSITAATVIIAKIDSAATATLDTYVADCLETQHHHSSAFSKYSRSP